jgi:hypothetical protein
MVQIKCIADKKVIIETLSRIGICNKDKKILYPSAYLWTDENNFTYIAHFKELFSKMKRSDSYNNMTFTDIKRRNAICFCLKNWGLIQIIDLEEIENHNIYVFVLKHSEKDQWQINHKINKNLIYLDLIGEYTPEKV